MALNSLDESVCFPFSEKFRNVLRFGNTALMVAGANFARDFSLFALFLSSEGPYRSRRILNEQRRRPQSQDEVRQFLPVPNYFHLKAAMEISGK